ncbi:MAG: S9 family peptidase [Bacteroidia bacterium]
MKKIVLPLLIVALAACQNKKEENTMDVKPPVAKKIPQEFTEHGNKRIDNYFWMRLSDEQKEAKTPDQQTQDVLDYLNAENAYTEAMMKHTEAFQKSLFEEMKGRIKEDDESVPYKYNGYYYITRYETGKEYPIHSRKKETLEAEEEIMINVNELAEGHAYYSASGMSVSPDNKLLAFGEDTVSRRNYTIRFKNLETGEFLEHTIPNTTGGVAWANDNKTVFYSKKDPVTLRSFQIYKHEIGSPSSEDKLVFEEKDETFYAYVYRSKSGRFIMIGSSSTMSDEVRFLDANNPNSELKTLQARERGLEYSAEDFEDKFYIITNQGGATNFKLVSTPISKPSKENWKEEIAHRAETRLESFEIFRDFMVLEERTKGLNNLRIINKKENSEHYISFEEEAYSLYSSINMEYDTDVLRYGYASLTTPSSTYDYNMNTKERILLKEQQVLGGKFDKNNYESKRYFAKADDGTEVPISLVYKKGIKLDGNNPTLLYGYGSYGASMDVYFSSLRLSLLDRGFVFAIAHVRGGEDMGRQWYEDGKLLKKKNTFTDFIDCAEFLIEKKYTSTKHLYAQGGSAGGLLMGAVVNMRPDLWNGIVAQVPFVDVINTMLDETIPLTTGEFDEWGNPKDKEYYDYIITYSPYDNVEAKDYPNMLITTGYWDSQVQYWEPAKWVAKLRELKTDNNKLLMKCNMEVGHGGASGRFESLKEVALEYAFLFDLEGIKE